jgi:pilus assembly protein TadC
VVVAIALGWGALVHALVAGRSQRLDAKLRARDLGERGHARARSTRRRYRTDVLARVGRDARRRLADRKRTAAIEAQASVAIDLLAVAIGAGSTPVLAVEVAARWAPPLVAERFARVARSCAMGESFTDAVARLDAPSTSLGRLGARLAEAATLGAPLLETLDRLAIESRAAFHRRAEARARTVPVRLLFPLVFLVLPAFGLITVVPAIDAGLRGG